MARLTSRAGRSRLPLIVLTAIVLVALLALAAYALRKVTGPGPAASSAPPASAATSPSTDPRDAEDPAPTGCLGGQARTADMVLATRRAAPHTTFGAVEVAAAFLRWGLRYPYPSNSEVTALKPAFSPSTAATEESQLTKRFSSGAYTPLPGRQDPKGTPFYLTTANGSWLVDQGSSLDRVDVELEAHPVVDGSYSTGAVTLAVDVRWSASGWQVHNFAQADAQALANGGTSFTSGC